MASGALLVLFYVDMYAVVVCAFALSSASSTTAVLWRPLLAAVPGLAGLIHSDLRRPPGKGFSGLAPSLATPTNLQRNIDYGHHPVPLIHSVAVPGHGGVYRTKQLSGAMVRCGLRAAPCPALRAAPCPALRARCRRRPLPPRPHAASRGRGANTPALSWTPLRPQAHGGPSKRWRHTLCFLCLADAVRFLGWGTAAVPHASLAGCACLLMGSAVAPAPFQPGHPAWAALASFGKQPVELDTDLGAAFSSRTLKRALKDKKVVRMFVVDRDEGAAVPCLGVVVECAGSDQAAREYCVHGGARIRGRCGWVPVECVRMVTFPQVGALGRTRLLFCGRARQAVAAHAYCALAPAAPKTPCTILPAGLLESSSAFLEGLEKRFTFNSSERACANGS